MEIIRKNLLTMGYDLLKYNRLSSNVIFPLTEPKKTVRLRWIVFLLGLWKTFCFICGRINKMQKLYCYVDETGQDTKSEFFIVVVVVNDENQELLRGNLCKIEALAKIG